MAISTPTPSLHSNPAPPPERFNSRTNSYSRAAHRVRLFYHDEAIRQRTEARAKCLIADATSPTSSSTRALLAKKALKYRNVYHRMTGVDVNDPNFDVFEFLGVDWCKSEAPGRV